MNVNFIRSGIISVIKSYAEQSKNADIQIIKDIPDNILLRKVFFNYREDRGVRLTDFGLKMLQSIFKVYSTSMPPNMTLKPHHLIFLDQHTSMPYHCSANGFHIFDHDLGFRVKIAEGNIDRLIEMEDIAKQMGD